MDLETTGLVHDPEAEILEVGVVLLDPGLDPIAVFQTLLRPSRPLPRAIQRLTGLGDDDVAGAPSLAEVRPALVEVLAARRLVAHNAGFERAFLARGVEARLAEVPMLDTQDLLAVTHPDAPDLRLESFTRSLLGREERHRALEDALDTARVISRVARGARAGEARYAAAREALEIYAADSPWLPLLGKETAVPEASPASPFAVVGESREAPVSFDPDAIAAALRDEARGRRHFQRYRAREEQVRLARHFARVLAEGRVALLEGGTGVGKSLAYLAAAIPWVMSRREEREPVVISTRTKLLQDQLMGKDIPAAARFLGHSELRALSIKGRANYACERRLARVLAEGVEPRIFAEDRLAYALLESCVRIRPHGEIGSVPAGWLRRHPALGDLLRRSVAARAEQCTREQCASHPACPLGRRRAALGEADLVVANHDLLLRWPPDYPPLASAIVDEVHELADVADEVFALEVQPQSALERMDDVFGRPGRHDAGDPLLPASARRAARRDGLAWRRGLDQELRALGSALGERAGDFGEVQIPARPGPGFAEAARHADAAATRLEEVADHVERLAGPGSDPGSPLSRTLQELRRAAVALRLALSGAGEDAVAAFEDVVPPWDRWRLRVRSVSPADAFHERFFERLRVFAGVSASLFVADDAFAALGELEIEARAAAPPGVLRASEPSPFPYAEHMRVVALTDGGDVVLETAAVLEHLARRLGGRTLGLFTSLRRMQEVAALLAPRLRAEGIEVLAPRRAADDPHALVERFSAGSAVLLGARKFWQGLDVPGADLQAVVIEKLPFEVPTELRRRREQRLRAAGADAFERYTLGKMLLNLKQMVGRLIRTEEDRGVVVIVEGRTDRPYFSRLAAALPPGCQVTTARRDELDRLLGEVGIGTTERPL